MSSRAHGRVPQSLIEQIVRGRIYESRFYKEHCFALSAEGLIEKAVQLIAVGGVFSERVTPAPFLCLIMKMLQILPEDDIVLALIRNEEFKYARALGAFYWRLTAKPTAVFKELEPLFSDYCTIRVQTRTGWATTTMDAFVEELLTESYSCDVALPVIGSRAALERSNILPKRVSPLRAEFEAALAAADADSDSYSSSSASDSDD